MIVNPIIPIWLMTIISIILIILIIYNNSIKEILAAKTARSKKILKKYFANIVLKIAVILLLFVINLRPMIPNGEATYMTSDMSVLFVIDTTVSMRALDYNGNQERFEGVVNDCCTIVNELSGCKFSIITFGNTAEKIVPFTTDSDMVQAELKAINVEDSYYAQGTSINIVKDVLEETLEDEYERQDGDVEFVVFFVSDGEITAEGEELESFDDIAQYISNGAVMGYGTESGGKMVNSMYEDMPTSSDYYLYYYDDDYKRVIAISKIDETNLNQIASDLGIDYIQMSTTSKLDDKLNEIQEQMLYSQTGEENTSYQDIYYYFAIPLVILLIINFIMQKRRIQ